MLIQSQYLSGDFAGASKELTAEIQAAERAGRAPAEDRLKLLLNAAIEAERQQRLRLRDREAGHLLPEEGVLGRPAEPHAAQARLLRPALARHLSPVARHRQHDGSRPTSWRWPSSRCRPTCRAKASRWSTRASPAARSAPAPRPSAHKRLRDLVDKKLAEAKPRRAPRTRSEAAAAKDGDALVVARHEPGLRAARPPRACS